MKNFTWDMSSLASHFLPDQEMANAISLEIARAHNTVPSYDPYVIPQLTEKPWVIPTADHAAAMTRWKNGNKDPKKRARQELSFQCWITYQLRFMITSQLCGALAPFGGIASQFNHLAICLNLAVSYNVATAISYDRLVKDHLHQLARRRDTNFDFPAFLKKENQEFKRRAVDENAIEARPQLPKDPIRKGKAFKGDGKKGFNPPPAQKGLASPGFQRINAPPPAHQQAESSYTNKGKGKYRRS